jgi:hypothetical protein
MIRTTLLCCVLATPVLADTPLAPPSDFENIINDAVIRGDATAGTTTIGPLDGNSFAAWTIPVWARWYWIAPSNQSALVLGPGGNLVASQDPDQIVASLYWDNADGNGARHLTLSELMDPGDMPQTVSHYSWLNGVEPIAKGWRLHFSDGRRAFISYE